MFKLIPTVIQKVVVNDLCIGCGACIDVCPAHALSIKWDDNGLLLPYQVAECDGQSFCLSVCPFNPDDETTIDQLNESDEKKNEIVGNNEFIGQYSSLYAGHSDSYRATSSSGGVGTWIVSELFKHDLIDFAIGVRSVDSEDKHFEYQIINKADSATTFSKTKYYPVTLAGIFEYVIANPGNYVLTGLPCFLKSVRLYQKRDTIVKNRIKYLVGITCGGMKSRFFTEFLAWKVDILPDDIINPEYRIKTYAKKAGDYSFGFVKENKLTTKNIRLVGDTWGNGIFKPNACDYCDDIFADLADVSIGDAWIEPYSLDSRGANLVIVRSLEMDGIIKAGISTKELNLTSETEDRIISTQRANIIHRRLGLKYRLSWKSKEGVLIKGKRIDQRTNVNWIFLKVQKIRMLYRSQSFISWRRQRLNFKINSYDLELGSLNRQLKFFTKSRHYLTWSWYARRIVKLLYLLKK